MMSTSTDAKICYGIVFDEEFEFPWGDDIEEWWINNVLGFVPSYNPFDENGDYKNGSDPGEQVISKYFSERREFKNINQECPVVEVNYCSADYPMMILAARNTVITARRGFPEHIELENIANLATDETKEMLTLFCKTHGINAPNKPNWYLASYWG